MYRVGALLAYADFIEEFFTTYHPKQWLEFDTHFRAEATTNPNIVGDQIDNCLWASKLGILFCRCYLQQGHLQSDQNCVQWQQPIRHSTKLTNTVPSSANVDTPICKSKCSYLHDICSECRGPHCKATITSSSMDEPPPAHTNYQARLTFSNYM